MTTERGLNGYPLAQAAEIQSVLAAMPYAQVYNAVEDGEVLVLCEEGKYLISVSPAGNTSSAYLINQPPSSTACPSWTDEEVAEVEGWATGWTC